MTEVVIMSKLSRKNSLLLKCKRSSNKCQKLKFSRWEKCLKLWPFALISVLFTVWHILIKRYTIQQRMNIIQHCYENTCSVWHRFCCVMDTNSKCWRQRLLLTEWCHTSQSEKDYRYTTHFKEWWYVHVRSHSFNRITVSSAKSQIYKNKPWPEAEHHTHSN